MKPKKRSYTIVDNEFMTACLDSTNKPYGRGEAYWDLVNRCTYSKRTKKVRGVLIHLNENEGVAPIKTLATAWRWEERNVRTFIKFLIKEEIFKVKKHPLVKCNIFKPMGIYVTTDDTISDTTDDTSKPANYQAVTKVNDTTDDTTGVVSSVTQNDTLLIHTNNTNNLLKEEEEKEGFYDKKFPSKKMAYDAAKFIERKIVNGELEKVSKKIETSKADLQILLSEFRSYYETLEGRFFINDNAKSEKSVLAVFSSFVESKIKSDINTSNNLKSSNEPNWNANKTISLMKTIWECEHPTRILSNGDKNHFGEILKSINKIIKGKRAAEGLLGYTPSDEEKINIWTNFVKNMPNFLLEGNYSFKFIASDFPNLQRQSETEGQKVVQLNDFEFKAQMLRDFYTANDENEQKMMRMKFASGLSNESLKPIINDFIKSHKSWDKDADLNKIHLDLIRFINSLRVDGYIDYEITRKEESMLMKQGVIFQKRRAAII